MNFISF